MQTIERVVPDDFNLFLFGDTHYGAVHCHESGIDQLIQSMLVEYDGCSHNVGVHHGDAIESIMVDDKRFSLEATDMQKAVPMVQSEYAAKKFEPVKDLLVAWLMGNHEDKLIRFGNLTHDLMLKDLGKQEIYGTLSSVITYIDKDRRPLFKHYAHHGFGSIKSIADDPEREESNKRLMLKRKLKKKMGDCVLLSMGHTHQLLTCTPTAQLYINTTKTKVKQGYTSSTHTADFIHPDHRFYVNTGSFLRLYVQGFSGYAEKRGLDPVQLGYAVAVIRDRQIQRVDLVRLD